MVQNNELSSFFKDEYKKLMEGLDSSSDMINNNIVNPEEMKANVKPGEFAPNEITNKENLENTAKMSNDNDVAKEDTPVDNAVAISISTCLDDNHGPDCDCPECQGREMIDISKRDSENCDKEICDIFSKIFGESKSETAKALLEATKEVIGSDYAGPLDFNPDTRINTADVLNTLKKEIGKGSEGIHVDRETAQSGKYVYKVSQVDEKLLPKKIKVMKQELELKDGSYIPSELTEEEPK